MNRAEHKAYRALAWAMMICGAVLFGAVAFSEGYSPALWAAIGIYACGALFRAAMIYDERSEEDEAR